MSADPGRGPELSVASWELERLRLESEHRLATARWEAEVALTEERHARELAEWRLARTQARRGWRVVEALSEARRPAGLLRLLPTLLRILFRSAPLPSAPEAPSLPEAPEPPEIPPRPDAPRGPSVKPHVDAARQALADGDLETARQEAETVLALAPDDVRALDVRWQVELAAGDLRAAARTLGRQRDLQDRLRLQLTERRVIGLQTALDPRWLPTPPALPTRGDGPVLSLDLHGTSLDLEHRLVTNETDPQDPLDVRAEDLAWRAALLAKEVRPRAIVAPLGPSDLAPALAAVGLQRTSGVPALLVLHDGEIPGGQHGRLTTETIARLGELAALGITSPDDPGARLRTEG